MAYSEFFRWRSDPLDTSQHVLPQQLGFLVAGTQYDGFEIGDALYELSAPHTLDGLYEHNWPWQHDARVHPRPQDWVRAKHRA